MDSHAPQLADPKRFWGIGEVLRLALPTSLSMLNATVLHFVDGLMVARIQPAGAEALSAQFVGGALSFAPTALAMGTLSVVSTFVAQNLGAGRLNRCREYTWQALRLAWLYGLILLPLVWLAPAIFERIGHSPAVQAMEVSYFRLMILGTAIFLSCRVLEGFFFGVHKPMVVFGVSLLANGLNIVGDYALIFGAWGLPEMGVAGAALATVASAAVALAVLMGLFLWGPTLRAARAVGEARLRMAQVRQVLAIGWPAGLNFFVDILTWGVGFSVLSGQVQTVLGEPSALAGTVHMTASSVVMRYLHVSFMPAVGISVAISAIVGRHIGEKRLDLVSRRTFAALIVGVLYMGTCGLGFWLFRRPLAEFFLDVSPGLDPALAGRLGDIVAVTSRLMVLAAIFQVFDATNIVLIGALRGAGDTRWPALVMVPLAIVFLTGGGWLALRVWPGLESAGIWLAGTIYLVVLAAVMLGRFLSGAWRRIDLLSGPPEALAAGMLTGEASHVVAEPTPTPPAAAKPPPAAP